MPYLETKLKTGNGDIVLVDSDSLSSATKQKKGAIKKGEGVAVMQEWGDPSYMAGKMNDMVLSLRTSGALDHDKFALIYEPNDNGDDADRAVIDVNSYTAGQTAQVQFISEKDDPPRRDGYEFLGWSRNPNATTAEFIYDPEDQQDYTVTFVDGDIVLYAIWKLLEYTVTYELGDYGQGSVPAPQTALEGEEVEISFSPAPTVNDGSGRVFAGWSSYDGWNNVEDVSYSQDGSSYIYVYGDITLYPVFCAEYTLTYALGNDATGTVPSGETVYNGAEIDINFNPSVTCISDNTKVFVGWSTTDESGYADYRADRTYSISMSSDVTLYPVFEAQGGGGGDSITIDNTNGLYEVNVWHYDDDEEPIIDCTIQAGQSNTFNYVTGIDYGIKYAAQTSITSVFTGSYGGTGYTDRDVSSDSTYGNAQIENPADGSTLWTFSSGDYGTLYVNQSNS